MTDQEREEERKLAGELVSVHAQLTRERGLPKPDAARVARYPGGRDDFLAQFRAATAAAVDAGFVLAADAAEIEGLGAQAWPA